MQKKENFGDVNLNNDHAIILNTLGYYRWYGARRDPKICYITLRGHIKGARWYGKCDGQVEYWGGEIKTRTRHNTKRKELNYQYSRFPTHPSPPMVTGFKFSAV
jgi:hypothetical protein